MRILLFACCIFFPIFLRAQCAPAPSDKCKSAPMLCSIEELNGYSCTHINYTTPISCNPLCGIAGGSSNNVSWWRFFASKSANVCITLTVNNCNNNGQGLMMGLIHDCSCGERVFCDAQCVSSGSVTYCANLYRCETYSLFVNGCGGDVCDFSLSISGPTDPKLFPVSSLSGPTNVCYGAKNIYYTATDNLNNKLCEYNLEWTLDGILLPNEHSNKFKFDALNEGAFDLCVVTRLFSTDPYNCTRSDPSCIHIKVVKDRILETQPVSICEYLFPFTWGTEIITESGTYTSEFQRGNCLVDSTKTFVMIPSSIDPCKPECFVTGIVYYDIDGDGRYSIGFDIPADGVIITTEPGSGIAVSNGGKYKLTIEKNTVNVFRPYFGMNNSNNFLPMEYKIATGLIFGKFGGSFNFGIQLKDSVDLGVELSLGRLRAGSIVRVSMDLKNLGSNNVQNSELSLEVPKLWQFVNAETITSSIEAGIAKWTINTSNLISDQQINVYYRIPGNTPFNTKFTVKAKIAVQADKNLSNNQTTFSDVILNSYDPNDKLVQLRYVPTPIPGHQELLYTIRFQNCGNDTANKVIIKDSLSSFLEPKTIRIVNSSHPCRLEMEILGYPEFHFDNINLIDSAKNIIKSQGFVQFTILIKDKVDPDISIANRAAIFFDNNPGVLTNWARTSLIITNEEDQNLTSDVEILPNPVAASFVFVHPKLDGSKIQIVDLQGRVKLNVNLSFESSSNIDCSQLESGIYILNYFVPERRIISKKFVKF